MKQDSLERIAISLERIVKYLYNKPTAAEKPVVLPRSKPTALQKLGVCLAIDDPKERYKRISTLASQLAGRDLNKIRTILSNFVGVDGRTCTNVTRVRPEDHARLLIMLEEAQ